MAISSSSSSSNNGVPSCSGSCSNAYEQFHSQYDKLTVEFQKSQIDVLSYQACLESVEARLVLYRQNESILQENINMLKNEVEAMDNVLVTLKQKLNQAEKERDDLKQKFDKIQTSSQSLTELLASQKHDKHGLGYFSESDSESSSPSCSSDRMQPSGGYNVVPPPITGNFMPPKPDLVFHTAPIAVETDHSDWVPDTEDESKTTAPQIAPSFVQTSEHVKPSRHSVQLVETSIPIATPKLTSPNSNRSGKRKNRKTCFVCRSVDHLIKDLLTQSKPISITVVRPICAAVLKIMVTRPRHAHSIDTKSKSTFRRHITRGQSPKTSNLPLRVTAAQALVVSAAKDYELAASLRAEEKR
uniref:Uncharacterized protein n=1 Tax=Tanacetum cinerariifolium TaxID=118510 RepID=A0A699IX02_TANCI|nr:hypothetical protein [Tanacetum cinerariifolium]